LPEDAVVGQDALHEGGPVAGDVREQHVLLRSEAHSGVERADDAAEPTAQSPLRAVLDAAVLDEHAVERASVRLLMPSNVVLDVLDLYGRGWSERTPQLPLYLVAEPVETPLVEQVLEACVAPIAAVAMIALDLHHGLGHFDRHVRAGKPAPI